VASQGNLYVSMLWTGSEHVANASSAHQLDMRDISQYEAREDLCIRHTARSTSMSPQYINHLGKDSK
jgi:hypothetical protein